MDNDHRAKILVVDDSEGQRKTMSLIMRHKGYGVATANDGCAAVERVREEPYDVIFMDIKMPQMNGVEAFRRIKAARPSAVVVMMTAYALQDLVQQALDEGAYGVAYKPLDLDYVLKLVEEIWCGRSFAA